MCGLKKITVVFVWVMLVFSLSSCGSKQLFVSASVENFKPTMTVNKVFEVAALGGYAKDDSILSAGSSADHPYPLTPALNGRLLVVVSDTGLVSAIDSTSGSVFWKVPFKEVFSTSAVIGRHSVFVATATGKLMALDRQTGALLWQKPMRSGILAKVLLMADKVVVRTQDHKIHALLQANGSTVWSYTYHSFPETAMRSYSAPVLYGSYVLFGSNDGNLVVLNQSDGAPIAQYPIFMSHRSTPKGRMAITSDPVVNGQVVYLTSLHSGVSAFNLHQAKLEWHTDGGSAHQVAMSERALYIVTPASDIIAYDIHSGRELWKQAGLHGQQLSSPVVVGHTIVVAKHDGQALWLAKKDGAFLARTQISSKAISANPVTDGKAVYFYSLWGKLTKFL